MSVSSTIEWTDATYNPTRGCTKVSPGCAHCYAATFANRFVGVKGSAYEEGFTPRLAPEMLHLPLTWSKPKRVFVNSMSDLFHSEFPVEYLLRVVDVMAKANWHTFQVLTKRPERMCELLSGPLRHAADLDNVWWGVSVENRKHGLPRIDYLRRTPAKVRFLSVEPLLEDLGDFDLTGIHWVIVGGESGHGARLLEPDWVRSIREQCAATNVPFFFKQWGGRNKKATGRVLDGRTHDEMPAVSPRPVPALSERRALIEFVEAASITQRIPLETLADTEPILSGCGGTG